MSSSPDRRRRLTSSPASATTEGRKRDASGTSADDDPSSRCRPFHSPSRSHVQPLCSRFRARLPHSANVRRRTFAPLGLLLFRTRQTRPSRFGCHGSGLQNLRPEPGCAHRRVARRDGSAAMSDNPAVARALNAARARTCFGNGKQKRDPRGHVKRDPPVSVNSSVHDLLPWRLFRGCSDLADGLTLAVHIVTCALRSHSRARRVRLSADAPGGVRNRPP